MSEFDGPSDAELIDAVRSGNAAAYGPLYERHSGAARNLARQLARSQAEADDLVSEAFAKVLETLRQGRGPDAAFRAYLLTALRHTAYDKTRRDRKVEFSDDVSQVSGINQDQVSVPFSDTAIAGLERSLAARAFRKLPERWQAVLWHTEIEGQSPAEVAPLLGLTPNGVSALAYRAREGLKQAYLQVHLAEAGDQRCRATAERLGAWVRGGLSKREKAQVEAHLDECDRCRALAAELADVNSGLRLFIAPLVLGPMAVAGYLGAAKATAVVGAGVAAGASGGGVLSAITSAPRQAMTVAVSGAALVAAVVVGLVAAPNSTQVPAAVTSNAPTTTAPRPTPKPQTPPVTPPEPVPTTPEPPPSEPTTTEAPEPTTTAPTTTTTAPTTTTTPAPTPTPEPPQPRPNLSASGPGGPVSLTPGAPTEVPITVTNSGDAVSEPVVAALPLPTGVRAVSPSRLSAPPLLRLNAQATTIDCPAGTGRVVCSTERGLQPGETITLVYRLVADDAQLTAQIAGTLTAGTQIELPFTIGIEVTPLPDGVDLTAALDDQGLVERLLPWGREVRVAAWATNTGESTKAVAVTFDRDAKFLSSDREVSCTAGEDFLNCVSTTSLRPGEQLKVIVGVRSHYKEKRNLTVTAALGTATDSVTIRIPHRPICCEHRPEPNPPKPTTTTTTPAPTTPPTTTTSPTKPTTTAAPTTTTTPPVTTAPTPKPEPPVVIPEADKPLIQICLEIGRSRSKWWKWDC
ncbi:sigma-70 family RNA polymerase sigma factor [Actinokineospora terrae]|uniref:RNA polymerase sigma factor, sigma-70 family n=1 Tax=Actinokineospora terrae TaxID=155974 RepID=A0A1H9SDB9_9PSEU|nr:sigma-70 family RNA polymerase sigma factor [Actinokineospora terrae]SER83002.1 RNA polymerase sigma factor, sigma-70 family [Actinokineospora terrae]